LCANASTQEERDLCANASTQEEGGWQRFTNSVVGPLQTTPGQGLRNFRRVSLEGIEPVGFRVKSDLRNHQAIVQPRLYDSLMVTQITLGGPLRLQKLRHIPGPAIRFVCKVTSSWARGLGGYPQSRSSYSPTRKDEGPMVGSSVGRCFVCTTEHRELSHDRSVHCTERCVSETSTVTLQEGSLLSR
jgi:hypothetical protein